MTDLGALFLGIGLAGLGFGLGWPLMRGLSTLGACISEASWSVSEAMRYEARLRGGLIRKKEPPKPEPTPDERRFMEWIAVQGFEENEYGHVLGMFEGLIGKRPASEAAKADYRAQLAAYEAPLP